MAQLATKTQGATVAVGTQGPGAAGAAAAPRTVPFAQASKRGRAQYYTSAAYLLGAAQQSIQPASLPSDGYLRGLWVNIATTSAGTGGTAEPDYPAAIFALLRLRDTNGAPIFELSGWHTLLAQCYGGYEGVPDPRAYPDYTASVTAPAINLRIPIEIDPTGVGALPNLSAQSAFRLEATLDILTNLYSSSPSPAPTVQFTVWADYWTLPEQQDMLKRTQETAPPYEGTVQLWTEIDGIVVSAGSNRLPLTRMGNLLRTVIAEFRNTSTPALRIDTAVGDPLILRWDDLNLLTSDRQTVRADMRAFANDLTTRDVGVYVFGNHNYGVSRFNGGSGAASYLATVTATRYELQTPSGVGSGGVLNWIVNDVTTSPTSAQSRATAGGGLGFHPPVGQTGTGAM